MRARTGGIACGLGLVGWLAAALGGAACGDGTGQSEFPPLAGGTVTGTVSGTGGVPLDSVRIEVTVPSQLSLYAIGGGAALSDAGGRFLLPVALHDAPDPHALPDTLAIYITATALPPRYTPPAGKSSVRDSVLVAVALAPRGERAPVTEVQLALPVDVAQGPAVRGLTGAGPARR